MSEFFLIAEVIKAVDDSGLLEIKSHSDFPERFFVLDYVFIDVFGSKKKFLIDSVKASGKNFLLKFRGFDSADKCKFLIGKQLFVDENNLYRPGDEFYFIHDLIGSRVFINNKFFGYLEDVLQLPANDVYVIRKSDSTELLVPALKKYIKNFDAGEKRLDFIDDLPDYFDEN